MGLSRRASMAYGRAASGIQLSTHVSGGGLSAGWEEEEVERGEAGEKWLGSRILAYSESGEKADADADAGCGHRRRLMRWRQWAGGLGSEGGLERRDESGGRGRGERRARRRSSAAAARSRAGGAMGVCCVCSGRGKGERRSRRLGRGPERIRPTGLGGPCV